MMTNICMYLTSETYPHVWRSVWDLASGEVKGMLEGHTDRVTSVAFSPDGRTIVSGSGDNTVR